MLNCVCKKKKKKSPECWICNEICMRSNWMSVAELQGSEVSSEKLDKMYQTCSRLKRKVLSRSYFMINLSHNILLTLLFNTSDHLKKERSLKSSPLWWKCADCSVSVLQTEMCWPRFLVVFTPQQSATHLRPQALSCSRDSISPVCVCRCASILIILPPKTYTRASEEYQKD